MAFYTRGDLRESGRGIRERAFSTKTASQFLAENLAKAAVDLTFDIFLSHSFLDADEVLGLKADVERFGFSVYVDWIDDPQLDRDKVTPATADRLRARMTRCRTLLYVASPNSLTSKWMPWELGYFDGIKGRVAILPVFEGPPGISVFKGQEYLGLYPYVTKDGIAGQRKDALWVNVDGDTYVQYQGWLEGRHPRKH